MKNISLFLLLLSFSFACVSAKKYKALEADYQEATISTRGQENQSSRLEVQNKRLEDELFTVRKQNTDLLREITTQQNNHTLALNQLQAEYDRLQNEHAQLKEVSAMEANYNRQKLQNAQNTQNTQNPNSPQQIEINNYYPNQNPNTTQNTQTLTGSEAKTSEGPNSVNKTNSSLLGNLPDQKPASSSPIDVNKLYAFQNRMADALTGFSADEIQIRVLNNQVYVVLNDDMMFANQQDFSLSQRGQQAMQKITQIILQQGNVSIEVENEPSQAQENNLGFLKSQSISKFFASKNLACKFNNKNFSPLAYNTSGTQAKTSKTTLALSL